MLCRYLPGRDAAARRALAVPLIAFAQKKDDDPKANPENIAAALKLTRAGALEYEIRVGEDENEEPLELLREPVLKWSNPDRGEVHGNVFLWTRDGRPLAAGSAVQVVHAARAHDSRVSIARGRPTRRQVPREASLEDR